MSPHAAPELPAWSARADSVGQLTVRADWPSPLTREWALGDATGAGVRVCLLDSGVESDHPLVGPVQGAVVVEIGEDGAADIVDDDEGDVSGHGTACASIVRAVAPAAELYSVRVLGSGVTGTGQALIAGLLWALDGRFDIVNMSLSTTKRAIAEPLHELADRAYFDRTILVAAAHNMPVESYPWRFATVISVGSHDAADPLAYFYNPTPPVEFFARGIDVEGAWLNGATMRYSGNSFAAPHMSGILARILSKHQGLTPFELRTILYLTSENVAPA